MTKSKQLIIPGSDVLTPGCSPKRDGVFSEEIARGLIRTSHLRSTARHLALFLTLEADERGRVAISTSHIRLCTGICLETAREHLNEAQAAGWLVRDQRFPELRGVAVYELRLGVLDQCGVLDADGNFDGPGVARSKKSTCGALA